MNDDDIEKKTIENLKDIINPYFCLEVNKDKIVKIVLTEPRASLKKVTIYGFDYEKTYAFKLDAKDELDIYKTIRISEYLNPNAKQAINRGCDGIIFTYLNGIGYVFICEMKSGVSHQKDYIQQFRNSSVFIKFINYILGEFYEIRDNFQMRYILFDKKKNYGRTESHRKIISKKESYQGKDLYIYRIHHPNENRSLDIRLLEPLKDYQPSLNFSREFGQL
jgi:hypothetical protein